MDLESFLQHYYALQQVDRKYPALVELHLPPVSFLVHYIMSCRDIILFLFLFP